MNNERYIQILTATAGFASSAVLLVNGIKRAGLLAPTPPVQLVAPLAQAFAVVFVVGLWVVLGRRNDRAGHTATALNAMALSLVVGVEFVLNLVFPYSSPEAVADLRAGPLGTAFLAASVFFLLASWFYVFSLRRTAPPIALALYAVGVVPIALRQAFPPWALPVGILILVAGIVWLSASALRRPVTATA